MIRAGRPGIDQAALDRRLAATAIAVAVLAPRALFEDGRTICPIRRATGLPCPTCGLTRSVRAAGRLRLRDSLAQHPLGIPALGAAVLVATGRWRPSTPPALPSPAIVAGVAVWVATWALRLARAVVVARAPRDRPRRGRPRPVAATESPTPAG